MNVHRLGSNHAVFITPQALATSRPGSLRMGKSAFSDSANRRLVSASSTLIAVTILAGLAAFAVQMRGIDVDPPPVDDAPGLPIAAALQPPAPPSAGARPGRPAMAGPGWRVVSFNSISGVLMVVVETERLDDMAAVARDVVAPAAPELLEALVYFHRPGASGAAGRVQWTPDAGYVPLEFAGYDAP